MRRVKKGMTLLEVVIALGIMAIMIGPLMNSLLTGVRANKKGEEVQDAKLLGQQIVEKLRLTDDIKAGTLTLDDITLNLGAFVPTGTTGTKGHFPVTSPEVDGYQISGKIHQEDIKIVNENEGSKKYIEKQLGGLIIVDDAGVYYHNGLESLKIGEYLASTGKFTSYTNNEATSIDITFDTTGEGIDKKNIIKLGGVTLSNDTIAPLGIYVRTKNKFNFKISNPTTRTSDVYIFRDSNLSKEEGTLDGKLTLDGKVDKYTNIIYDASSSNTGLYSVKLDILKKGELVEKIESQLYVGE